MHSVLFSLDHITIYSYGACLALAIVLNYLVMTRIGRPNGYTPDFVSTLLTLMILTGLIGARLFYVVEHWGDYSGDLSKIFKVQEGGLMFYGGFIMGGISLIAFCLAQRKPVGDVLDLVVTAVPLGQAIGRVGCFLNGCCYGKLSDSPLAVCYPKGSEPWTHQIYAGIDGITAESPLSLPGLPSQLFETALTLVIFAVLVSLYKHRRHQWIQVARYMVMYGAARFLVEFSRADPRLHFGPLSIGQTISIALMIGGIAIMIYLRTQPANVPRHVATPPAG